MEAVTKAVPVSAAPDYVAIKSRQQATWASGDFGIIGTTLQIVGESLCEAVDLRAGERVLDVAAGNGNATLAAARRFAGVTSTDYVPALLERGRARAAADGFDVTFEVADAEALPYADASYDVVLSTFDVMFAPDQSRASRELLRVARPGGRIVIVDYHRPRAVHPLFAPMAGVLATLEPFALDLWRHPLTHWLPADRPMKSLATRRYFGGLYQLVTITV